MDDNEGIIYEEFDVIEIEEVNGSISLDESIKKVLVEVSLKIIINQTEFVSLLCLNKYQQELALGFLYNEGIIDSYQDILTIDYNERLQAVIIELRDGVLIDRQESLRSVTSGCGKCYTYLNPLKKSLYEPNISTLTFSAKEILDRMKQYIEQAELYKKIGGVHSVLFYTEGLAIQSEDIGRHNCIDKIAGILLKLNKLQIAKEGIAFISGRVTSEIMTKVIRLGVPVVVSKSTPTIAAIRLAREFNISLLGYVKGNKGTIYACPQRIEPSIFKER